MVNMKENRKSTKGREEKVSRFALENDGRKSVRRKLRQDGTIEMFFLGYLAIYTRGKTTGRKRVARGKSRCPQKPDHDDEDRERERERDREIYIKQKRKKRERERKRERRWKRSDRREREKRKP